MWISGLADSIVVRDWYISMVDAKRDVIYGIQISSKQHED
jgi:hypothetical protein